MVGLDASTIWSVTLIYLALRLCPSKYLNNLILIRTHLNHLHNPLITCCGLVIMMQSLPWAGFIHSVAAGTGGVEGGVQGCTLCFIPIGCWEGGGMHTLKTILTLTQHTIIAMSERWEWLLKFVLKWEHLTMYFFSLFYVFFIIVFFASTFLWNVFVQICSLNNGWSLIFMTITNSL